MSDLASDSFQADEDSDEVIESDSANSTAALRRFRKAGSKPFVSRTGGSPSRKRTSSEVGFEPSKPKRPRARRNDHYRKLYNQNLTEVLRDPREDHKIYGNDRLGAVFWTAREKASFFYALKRRGRHNLPQISIDIGSKSEPEVAQYINLINDSIGKNEYRIRHDAFSLDANTDAAFEVGADCENALERFADELALSQLYREEKAAKKEYGKLWLLTSTTAKWSEKCLSNPSKIQSLSESLPQAELLNLKNFLLLSENLFMNSSKPESNWRSYERPWQHKGPTMMLTAFSDFHNLAISVTKRLISSALFMAMSRIRASEAMGSKHGQHVRPRDVATALNILGMKSETKSYWASVARRCNLEIVDDTKNSTRRISYKEVERKLVKSRKSSSKSASPHASDGDSSDDESEDGEPSKAQDISDIENASEPELSEPSSPSITTSNDHDEDDSLDLSDSDESIDLDTSEKRDREKHDRMDLIDKYQSQQEEKRLWEVMGEKPPEHLDDHKPSKDMQLDYGFGGRYQTQDDWTDWVDYAAEWETLDTPVPEEAFRRTEKEWTSMRRKRELQNGNDASDEDDEVEEEADEESEAEDRSHRALESSASEHENHETLGDTDMDSPKNRQSEDADDYPSTEDEAITEEASRNDDDNDEKEEGE